MRRQPSTQKATQIGRSHRKYRGVRPGELPDLRSGGSQAEFAGLAQGARKQAITGCNFICPRQIHFLKVSGQLSPASLPVFPANRFACAEEFSTHVPGFIDSRHFPTAFGNQSCRSPPDFQTDALAPSKRRQTPSPPAAWRFHPLERRRNPPVDCGRLSGSSAVGGDPWD